MSNDNKVYTLPSGRTARIRHSSLRVRWTAGLVTLLVLTVVTGAVNLLATRRITSGFESTASEVDRETAVMNRLRLAVAGEESLAHLLVDTGAAAAPTFLQLDGAVEATLTEARATYDDDVEIALIDSVRAAWNETFAPLRLVAADADRANSFEASLGDDDSYHGQIEAQLRAVVGPIDQLDSIARESIHQELASARAEQRKQTMVLGSMWLLSAGFTVVLGRRFARGVLRPIQELWQSADRFARGDLHHRATVLRADELGELATRFNSMADSVAANHERLTLQAFHDSLTGLTNRAGFLRELHAVFGEHPETPMPSVLFIDLDDFKDINDTMGHDAGDALLIEVAKRLEEACRSTDIVTRLGGDEFAVLIDTSSENGRGKEIAERILELLGQPFTIHGRMVSVGASIGLATRSDTATTVVELIRRADIAMYTAKGRGKNRLEVFDMNIHGELLDRTPQSGTLEGLHT